MLSRDAGLFPFFFSEKLNKVSLSEPVKGRALSRGTVPKLTPHADLLMESSSTYEIPPLGDQYGEKGRPIDRRSFLGSFFFSVVVVGAVVSLASVHKGQSAGSGQGQHSQLTGIRCLAQGDSGLGDASQDASARAFQPAQRRQAGPAGWLVGWSREMHV